MKYLLLSSVLLCAVPALAQDAPSAATTAETPSVAPLDWQIRLQSGQKFRTTVETTMKTAQNVPGPRPRTTSRLQTESKTRLVLDQNVLSSDANGARIETVYRDLKQTLRVMQNGKLQFDSAKPPQGSDVLSDVTKSIIGARIRYTLNHRGEISDVQGFEEYFNRIWASSGKGQSAAQQKAFRQTFEKMMSPQAFKTMFEQSMGALPPGSVGVGESWNYKLAVPAAMTFIPSVSGKRTFVGRQNNLVVIDETATFSTNRANKIALPKPANSPGAVQTMQIALSGAQSGQTLVDESSGMARQSRLKMRMHGKIALNNSDGKGSALALPLDALMEINATTQQLSPDAR